MSSREPLPDEPTTAAVPDRRKPIAEDWPDLADPDDVVDADEPEVAAAAEAAAVVIEAAARAAEILRAAGVPIEIFGPRRVGVVLGPAVAAHLDHAADEQDLRWLCEVVDILRVASDGAYGELDRRIGFDGDDVARDDANDDHVIDERYEVDDDEVEQPADPVMRFAEGLKDLQDENGLLRVVDALSFELLLSPIATPDQERARERFARLVERATPTQRIRLGAFRARVLELLGHVTAGLDLLDEEIRETAGAENKQAAEHAP